MKRKEPNKDGQVVVYQAKDGAIQLHGDITRETIWASQAQMAAVFEVNPQAITKHIRNIYREGELLKKSTCSKMEHVRMEGGRNVKRDIEVYNLDVIIAVGYRISSKTGTKFRQWATRTLRQHIIKGYTFDPVVIKNNYAEFQKAVDHIKQLLPAGSQIDHASVLELISAFADTWLSLDAYDKDLLAGKGTTKRSVELTASQLHKALADFKLALMKKGEATEIFAREWQKESVAGIVGNVMQSFARKPLYPTVEEKAAHLLYFIVKDHPFVDGNKRSGAYAFVWFLRKAGVLDMSCITPPALTALTLFIAESDPKHKDKMVRLVLQLLK